LVRKLWEHELIMWEKVFFRHSFHNQVHGMNPNMSGDLAILVRLSSFLHSNPVLLGLVVS
jgi:hypothetical protein